MSSILLIEDNKDVRENTAEILELSGYTVHMAPNGKVGVELATQKNPDLIICDIMMPELDGYGVLHLLNKNPETASIPFIFLTAKTERSDFRKGMDMGADDYISKPFDDIELLNAVETRIKKTALLRSFIPQDAIGIKQLLLESNKPSHLSENPDAFETKVFKKKQVIYSKGNKPSALYYIAKGKVKVFKTNEDGKELITDLYAEGDFLGYNALLEDDVYTDFAEVLEDAELKLIPKKDFMLLISNDKQIAHKFIKILAKDITEKEERLLNIAYNSLRKRVANGLLQVEEKFKKDNNQSPKLEMTREDLAQVVGTATESLIRTLSDFKSEKLIDIDHGKIAIINHGKLKNLIN